MLVKIKEEFLVKESRFMNLLIGIAFLAIPMASIIAGDYKRDPLFSLMYLTMIPAALIIRRGLQNRVVIRLNHQGIFYYNKKVTDWSNLVDASVTEYMKQGDIKSRLKLELVLRQFNDAYNVIYTIPISSTFNRSGEEIIKAIHNFNSLCKEST